MSRRTACLGGSGLASAFSFSASSTGLFPEPLYGTVRVQLRELQSRPPNHVVFPMAGMPAGRHVLDRHLKVWICIAWSKGK